MKLHTGIEEGGKKRKNRKKINGTIREAERNFRVASSIEHSGQPVVPPFIQTPPA